MQLDGFQGVRKTEVGVPALGTGSVRSWVGQHRGPEVACASQCALVDEGGAQTVGRAAQALTRGAGVSAFVSVLTPFQCGNPLRATSHKKAFSFHWTL